MFLSIFVCTCVAKVVSRFADITNTLTHLFTEFYVPPTDGNGRRLSVRPDAPTTDQMSNWVEHIVAYPSDEETLTEKEYNARLEARQGDVDYQDPSYLRRSQIPIQHPTLAESDSLDAIPDLASDRPLKPTRTMPELHAGGQIPVQETMSVGGVMMRDKKGRTRDVLISGRLRNADAVSTV